MRTPIRILFFLLVTVSPSFAEVPQMINYQGRVSVNGTNFDGTGQFQFALVGVGGSPVFWSNGASTVSLSVDKGLFSVLLGDTNLAGMIEVIPSAVFTNTDVRLRVWFDGGTGLQVLTPDPRIGAVGYAMTAARAETAIGILPTSNVTGARLNIGSGHTLSGILTTIAGGSNNTAGGSYTTIGGGEGNTVNSGYDTIGGGYHNTAMGGGCTVGGGQRNIAGGSWSTIGGGNYNTAYGWFSTVGGGWRNTASGWCSSVGGGQYNTASYDWATVGGGYTNTASGFQATVPGGRLNEASGTNSFAAGNRAKALHAGALVWGDSHDADIASTTNNQFTARCSGGVRFFSNTNATVGVELTSGAGAWSTISDRNAKENFAPVDTRAVLEHVASIPVTTWNMKTQDPSIRHIGPMAQDFKAAFAVGEDDRHISTSDADGVAFAAIQGLYQMVREKDAEIDALRAQLAELRRTVQRVGQIVQESGTDPAPSSNNRTSGGI